MVGVHNFNVGAGLNLAGSYFAGAGRSQRDPLGAFTVHAQRHRLDVQNDIGDVFAHTRYGRKFVEHTLDLDRGHGGALQRRQQDPAHRIAQRQPESTLQRFGNDRRLPRRVTTGLDI